jgi:hypothetical protein
MLPRKAQTCQRRLVCERVRIIVWGLVWSDAVIMSALGGGFVVAAYRVRAMLICPSMKRSVPDRNLAVVHDDCVWRVAAFHQDHCLLLVSVAPKLLDRWSRKNQTSDEHQRDPKKTFMTLSFWHEVRKLRSAFCFALHQFIASARRRN